MWLDLDRIMSLLEFSFDFVSMEYIGILRGIVDSSWLSLSLNEVESEVVSFADREWLHNFTCLLVVCTSHLFFRIRKGRQK